MGTRHGQSYSTFMAWGHLILLAGLICVWGPSARASFIVQAKGLDAQTRPGTLLHGQIRLLNALVNDPQEVHLKIVELMPIAGQQWRPVDPNSPKDFSKAHSCRKWMRLAQTEIAVGPVSVVVVPVDIRIPRRLAGFYRAAIVVNVPPPYSHGGVVTAYDLVVPVLLEVKEPSKIRPCEFGSEDIAVEIHPEPIKVAQDWKAHDPYRTYTGSKRAAIQTTFPARLVVTAVGTSPAGGTWRTSIDPNETYGTGEIKISVTSEDVRIERLTGGPKDVKVALVTVQVIPDLSDWPFFWQNPD